MLRAEMTTAGETTACPCRRCLLPPLTDIEAQAALRHVSNGDAAAFARGEVTLVNYYGCESCGAWAPTFAEAATSCALRLLAWRLLELHRGLLTERPNVREHATHASPCLVSR